MKQKMAAAETEAFKFGYVKSSNNIWGLPGTEWYPCGAGIPVLKGASFSVRIEPGTLTGQEQDSWPVALYVMPYGGGKDVLLRRFPCWGEYVDHCLKYGQKGF